MDELKLLGESPGEQMDVCLVSEVSAPPNTY